MGQPMVDPVEESVEQPMVEPVEESEPVSGPTGGGEPPALDLSKVQWLHTDVSEWSETSNLSSVMFDAGGGICLNHDKANSWPSRNLFDADLIANAWVFIWNESDDVWYGATWEWFRPGQTCKRASSVDGIHIKRGPYSESSGWEPSSGETLYFMVSGLARNSERNVLERSAPIKVIWP